LGWATFQPSVVGKFAGVNSLYAVGVAAEGV
jgi:hypothetical protein